MQLVTNWRRIATRSYSMWAVYLGILLLVGPELGYAFLEHQLVDPYVSGWGGFGLLIAGALGRLIKQGINDA